MPTVPTPPPDPVLETQVFWSRYRNPILFGLLALLMAVAGFGAYRFYTTRRDSAAATLLAQAKAAPDFQKVIDQYPSSTAAPSAYLLLAGQQQKEQKFADANTTLQKFVSKFPKHEFVTTAKMGIAGNLDSLGKSDEALETYRRLAVDYPRSFNAPLALLSEVPLLKQKGDIEGARRVCETVLTQYRDSYASTEATRYLRILKPAGAVPAQSSATSASAPVAPTASVAASP